MKRTRIQEEIYRMRFEDIYGKYQQKKLSTAEAAEVLGISERTFLRKRRRFEGEDFDGRFDLRLGKPSPHRAADAEVRLVTRLYAERYRGFSVKHFHEFAVREHGVKRSYSWTKNILEQKRLIRKGKRGGPHRQRRERRPMAGMMLHQDASKHAWIPGLGYDLDLIVTMDDATSKITSCFLTLEEGTMSTFQGLKETIESEGLFCSLYTDRGSHYFFTPEAGGKVAKGHLTQVGRALTQLGIKHMPAYSPEARGRSERMFATLQDRLPKELALHKITTIDDANRYIQEIYLPRHNQQFTVEAAQNQSAYTPWVGRGLEDILCLQEERTVAQDNTVSFNGLMLQIPKNDLRHHYVKVKVDVHAYPDGRLKIFHGPLCLGVYDQCGNALKDEHPLKPKLKGKNSKARSA